MVVRIVSVCFILLLYPLYSTLAFGSEVSMQVVRQQLVAEISNLPAKEVLIENREATVNSFVKDLKKISDQGLGSPTLFEGNATDFTKEIFKPKLLELEETLATFVERYQKQVKPIFLDNIKHKRMDLDAVKNRGDLVQLFFASQYNHKTGKPISGLLMYKVDISHSLFSSEYVDGGVLINFPEMSQTTSFQEAMQMEMELRVLVRMHREYQEGVTFKDPPDEKTFTLNKLGEGKSSGVNLPLVQPVVTDENSTHQNTANVSSNLDMPTAEIVSEQERTKAVHHFTKLLQSLNVGTDLNQFEINVLEILKVYEGQVRPILVNNIRLQRKDDVAQLNKGELIALFFSNRSNNYTGKPFTGKLIYKKDVSDSIFSEKIEEVGLLVEKPELKQAPFIQRALNMEEELSVFLQKHHDYLAVKRLQLFQ